jgi:hypothetical protein
LHFARKLEEDKGPGLNRLRKKAAFQIRAVKKSLRG